VRQGHRPIGTLAAQVALVVAVVGAGAGCGATGPGHGKTTAGATTKGTPSRTAGTTAPATAAATPVTGHVNKGVHTGDLRSFLLPVPDDATVQGDPGGSPLALADAKDIVDSRDAAAARTELTTYGFQAADYRIYRSEDGRTTVTVKLTRFRTPALAAAYDEQHRYSYTGITPMPLAEPFPARAYRTVPGSAYHQMLATSHQGDVQFLVEIDTAPTPSPALLTALVKAQYHRLATGH
jgi:hypothetical protein